METKTMNIYQKINEVKKQVNHVKKETLHSSQGYKSVASSMVLTPLSKALIEVGLVLISECQKLETIGFPVKTKFGESTHYKATVDMVYTWVNIDNPDEKITCPWKCDGVNTGASDKAVGAAYTYSEKYFMLKFFNIATDESDPDFRLDGEDESKIKPNVKKEAQPDNKIQCGNKTYDPSQLIKAGNIEEQPQDDVEKEVAIIKTTSDIYNSFVRAYNAGKTPTEKIANLHTNYKAWVKKQGSSEDVTLVQIENGLNYFVNKLVGK